MKKGALLLALVLLLVFVGIAAADSAERLYDPPDVHVELPVDTAPPLLEELGGTDLFQPPPWYLGNPILECKVIVEPYFSYEICWTQ